jgi:hypothetical protein
MSLRIVPLPIEQAKVPVFRMVCSRAPKALASQDTWGFLEALPVGELYASGTLPAITTPRRNHTLKPTLFALAPD